MTPLCKLAEKYVTDKYSVHRYTPVYYDLFKDRIDDVKSVLEIGIGSDKKDLRRHAASLKMWEEFFPNAQIVGLDKKQHLMVNQGRIKSLLADQGDERSMKAAATAAGGSFDLIVDDGSHQAAHQISSARVLMPFVKVGGYYIIEDIKPNTNVFTEIGRSFAYERLHTNKDVVSSVLCVIKKC